MFTGSNLQRAQELLGAIEFFSNKGWSPATSTNYSTRSDRQGEYIISRSGVDKSKFALSDLILINSMGDVLPPFNGVGIKSSAETQIHTTIYEMFPDINCVLHTHSAAGTVLSLHNKNELVFTGYEILKGLEGNTTHDLTERLPIVSNSQSISDILNEMANRFSGIHGFLINGHGLYTWGKDIASAKRHIETYEFLFECELITRRMQWQS